MVYKMETLHGSLDDIRAFCSVVEQGSISAAARQHGESKGGLSRRISRLERRVGATLLARTPRAVSPTEEGLAFHARARDALALLADAVEGARQSRSIPRGHLRVTAPHDLGLNLLPELIVKFRTIHPQIAVDLVLSDAALDLASHRIDLALRAASEPLPDSGYRSSSLAEFRIALYASPGYLAGRTAPSRPEELSDHDLVAPREQPGGAGRLLLTGPRGQRRTVVCRPVIRASDYAGVHRLLLADAGIGAIPDIVAAHGLSAGLLAPVLPEWSLARVQLHAISVRGREAPARVRVFREFMRRELTRMLEAIG